MKLLLASCLHPSQHENSVANPKEFHRSGEFSKVLIQDLPDAPELLGR